MVLSCIISLIVPTYEVNQKLSFVVKWLSVLHGLWSEGYFGNTQVIRQHWWSSDSPEPLGIQAYLGPYLFQVDKLEISRVSINQFH